MSHTPTDLFPECCPTCKRPYEQPARDFNAFWSDVPHKVGKAEAQTAWRKLSSAEKLVAHERVKPFYALFAKTYKDATPLHPVRYLKGKRWQDEGVAARDTAGSDAALRKAMSSPIASVREHAERMAQKKGIKI